jgi:hypothetical protein
MNEEISKGHIDAVLRAFATEKGTLFEDARRQLPEVSYWRMWRRACYLARKRELRLEKEDNSLVLCAER